MTSSRARLDRVKLAIQDLISQLQGDRVGLIAFAGRAFLQAPLTIDYEAVVEAVNDLDTKTIPEGGTNISSAITLATQSFGKSAIGKSHFGHLHRRRRIKWGRRENRERSG